MADNNSQGLGLYVKAVAGLCSVSINKYLLYEQNKNGHSFSTKINFWINEGPLHIRVQLSPEGHILQEHKPEVELFLHVKGQDLGLIVQLPEPTKPTHLEVVRRSDQSIEKIEIYYLVSIARPPFRDWISKPQPWIKSTTAGSLRGIYELYNRIESAFLSADKPEILKLAKQRIDFVSSRLQVPEAEMERQFQKDLDDLLSDDAIEPCSDARVQLKLFPIKKGFIYKLEWASGMSAIHTKPDKNGMQQGFQLYVAFIQNEWVWII